MIADSHYILYLLMKLSGESIKYLNITNMTKTGSTVLITGGSGLIGRHLTSLLLSEGYSVSHLSRKSDQFGKVRVYRWDPEKRILDPGILAGVDYIVHLAGANIGEKRWTRSRKREIINSRIDSTKLLFKTIYENSIELKAFISGSAVGYYGSITTDKIFNEEDPHLTDFLGNTCRLWEEAADLFNSRGIRTVKIRTAVVLEKNDSAMAKLLKPARVGIFPKLGSGRQYMPWIHIGDLCNIYLKAIQDERMEGACNAVAPQHITQKEFMRILARVMKKRFFHPPIPAIILKAALGEMSDVVLTGSRISADKIMNSGYSFIFPELEATLENILMNESC
jgi:uncharacterized protein